VNTRPCPHCGASIPEKARFCGQCGKTIAPRAEAAKTQLHASAAALPASAPAPDTEAAAPPVSQIPTPLRPPPGEEETQIGPAESPHLSQTLADPEAEARARELRDAALADAALTVPTAEPETERAPPPPQRPPPVGSDNRTMLGMPARNLPAPPPSQPSAQAFPPTQKTMMGVAIPGIAPTHEAPPDPATTRGAHGTMLGVAVPGIAPTREAAPTYGPGHAGHGHGPAVVRPIVPAPAALVDEPLPAAPPLPPKKGVPAVVVVSIVMVIVAFLGGVGAFIALRGDPPLSVQPQLDEAGRESLRIGCPSCPDGTILTLGASKATIEGGATVLPLPAPLSIGDNDLTVSIDRPGTGRDEDVKVHVPVAYRVRADLTTVSARPPTITVRVEAAPGSQAIIAETTHVLDESGRLAMPVPLGEETVGPSDEQRVVERRIPFTITPKGGKAESGVLTARTAITALHVDAPGLRLVTDKTTVPVAGQTKPGARVTIDGQPVTVDTQGRFGARVPLTAPGQKVIEIVASTPPLAPRTVRATVERYPTIDAAVRALEAESPMPFRDLAADPAAQVGELAVIDGEIMEARVSTGYTVLLVEEKATCASGRCLTRVLYGEEIKLARGDGVRVFGRVSGAVTAGGRTLPEIDAALVVPKGRGR
jgi:hypothetical protein